MKEWHIKCFILLQSAKSKLEPPHYDGVQSLALKGKYLFSGSRDNSIKKWNIETQQLIQVRTQFENVTWFEYGCDPCSYEQYLSSIENKAWKKIRACIGLELMTSAIPV